MRQFVCPECTIKMRPTAIFFSGERTYWSALPAQYALYDAVCRHRDNGLANGILGCAFMRQAIDPWLAPALDAGPKAGHEDMVPRPAEQPVATSDPIGQMVAAPGGNHAPESASVANLDAPFAALIDPEVDTRDQIQSVAAPVLRDIMLRFQSLGDNCEFGLLQRWAEAEPLDLLRFASFFIPVEHRLRRIVEALAVGFAGLGEEPSSIHCELQGDVRPRPYMVRETRWGLSYHIDEDEETIDSAVVHRQQVGALRFRRRKLLEDLREAHRVFVWKSNVPTREAEIRELVACLKNYGPNLLLWVDTTGGEPRTLSVEYAGGGLLKGYVRRFAPYHDATDIDAAAWYDMCQKAWTISEILRGQREWGRVVPR